MKNILLGFIVLSAVCLSCSKDETCSYNDSTITASASETAAVESYLTNANITGAQKHPSGFYYKITQAGTGSAVVNLCSSITITYIGKLTNGTVFDQSPVGQTRTFILGELIPGWQRGIPLISSGGKITLYIPPSLGYGSAPHGSIPANSILIFDIELLGVS
jgi:FKBP-type peptidyl-prolyl cis-trans isomerase FkpA